MIDVEGFEDVMQAPNDSAEIDEASARKVKERVLVFIVAFLGLLIVAGLAAVVLRIIYLSSTRDAQKDAPRAETAGAAVEPGAVSPDRLDLPAGAVIKSVSVSGDRLAVHYEASGTTAIAIVDLATGALVRRIDVSSGAPAH